MAALSHVGVICMCKLGFSEADTSKHVVDLGSKDQKGHVQL